MSIKMENKNLLKNERKMDIGNSGTVQLNSCIIIIEAVIRLMYEVKW